MEVRITSEVFLAMLTDTNEIRLADGEHAIEIESNIDHGGHLIDIRYDQERDLIVALVSGGEGETEVQYTKKRLPEYAVMCAAKGVR